MHAAGIAVGDERGHNVHQLLPFLEQGVIGRELLCNGVEAVVCQHDALGRARGAAGVDHHAGVAGVVGLRGGALALAALQELLPVQNVGFVLVLIGVGHLVADAERERQGVGRGEDDHTLHMGALGGLTAALVHHVQADEQVRVHFLNVIADALDAVAGVHQVQGGTNEVGSVERVDDLRGHHADHGDDIALFDADTAERGCRLFHIDDEVRIGELAAVIIQGRLAQAVLVLLADVIKCRAGGQGLVNVLLCVIFQPGTRRRRVENIFRCSHLKIHFLLCFLTLTRGGGTGLESILTIVVEQPGKVNKQSV